MRKENAERARRALDRRFSDFGPADAWTPPQAGWVRAIRDALGMSAAALADRMGVKEPAVFALERTERQGTARLDTLRRAAEALDCTFVYAMIPNQDLESNVRRQAGRIVDAELERARHTMALEDQEADLSDESRERMVDRVASTRGLWSKP
jgi:predicted DNA-binding mobile mystery protein A